MPDIAVSLLFSSAASAVWCLVVVETVQRFPPAKLRSEVSFGALVSFKSLIAAISVVLWLLPGASDAIGQNQRHAQDLILLRPQNERLVVEKNTQVAVLVLESIGSKHRTDAKVIVASDVFLEDTIIIRKGENPLVNLAVDEPKQINGAVLTLYIEAVPTLDGTEVPLNQILKVDAGVGCDVEGCELVVPLGLLLPFNNGPHATIPAGTLIGAHVTERTEIPAKEARSASDALLGERRQILGGGPAKVFTYMLGQDNPSSPFLPEVYVLKIDGKPAGRLRHAQWACFALADGHHTLRAGKQLFELDVAENRNYYLKMAANNGELYEIVQTTGFELDDQVLQQSDDTEKAFKTKCW